MPRVLITGFCAVPGPRRAGVQLRHVIRALTPMHNVDLLVAREGEQAYVERQGSVRVLRVPMHETEPRLQVESFRRALKRQLDGADYDVVHCRDAWSGMAVLEAREKFGFRIVYDLTRSPLGETTGDPALDAIHARDEETVIAASDLVLAPTPAAMAALASLGVHERVMLSPPGVDVDRFDWEEQTTTGVPKIMYLGSIDPQRGVRVLVRAMTAIIKEVDAKLVIAGTPVSAAFGKNLREGIRELGLSDKIDVLDPIDHDQLPALLATATVCVVPAAADLSPNPMAIYPTKVLEYMACRRAVVAPRRETIAEVLDDGREALLFEPGDPVDLARKVLRLVGEPQLRENLAARAYERVRRDFTASAARRAIRKAYEHLAERFSIESEASDDESPKVALLADDDFEATVFEESPAPPSAVDTALNKLEALEPSREDDDGTGSGDKLAPPPRPVELSDRHETVDGSEETMERKALAPVTEDSIDLEGVTAHARTKTAPTAAEPSDADDDLGDEDDAPEDDDDLSQEVIIADDGTPAEGLAASAPLSSIDGNFVAGEIEVPTRPPPRSVDREGRDRHETTTGPTPILGTGLGGGSPIDEDTGSRTHRRS